MPVEIVTLPVLSDNYAFLLHDSESGGTALIDAPDGEPILAALDQRGWTLSTIFLTHHHFDHIDGVGMLVDAHGAKVVGASADAHRLPPLDTEVAEGDTVSFAGHVGHVLDVSGHTVGHIAYHFPTLSAVFTGDSLMALGCGRVFEGTAPMMWASLTKLAALPGETRIYSGHEYTAANGRFAQTIDPENSALQARLRTVTAARADGEPTVPSLLEDERATNPFLQASRADIKESLGMAAASDAEVFGEIRARKDSF